jgi:hypothetical protein
VKTTVKVIGALVAVLAVLAVSSCNVSTAPSDELVAAAKELKTVIPAIQAGMSLANPDDPSDRALTPAGLKTSGASTGNNWTYGADTPADLYGVGSVRKRFPASGNYEYSNGDQCYFTLIPEPTLGATYYHMVLYTYPAFDLSVAYTTEEYIVNSAGTESWAWGNLNLNKVRDSWITLTTVYLDGTSGSRTVRWVSGTSGNYYPAFSVADPDPLVTASFDGYRIEDSATPPVAAPSAYNYSSHTTELLQGKKVSTESTQFYTETSTTVHSGLTYVYMDKKRRWAEDTYIVTRMEEDTAAGTRTIRSVGEVGTDQYYIDKVDIALSSGKIGYSSTHDVYDTVLPRGGNPKAKDYVALDLDEDSAGAGTFTGTLVETEGDNEITREIKVNRDSLNKFQVTLKYKSSKVRPKVITNDVSIPLTQQGLGGFSIPMQSVGATFTGYYEAGMLSGTIQVGNRTYEVVVADEGVAFDDVLYAY